MFSPPPHVLICDRRDTKTASSETKPEMETRKRKWPNGTQLASIEESLAEVTAIQRKLGITVDEDEEERDLEVGLVQFGLLLFGLVWFGWLGCTRDTHGKRYLLWQRYSKGKPSTRLD